MNISIPQTVYGNVKTSAKNKGAVRSTLKGGLHRELKESSSTGQSTPQDQKLKRACEDFEAILIQFMFKSMKKTIPGGSFFGNGYQQDIYESLFFQEIATKMARERGLGISEALYRQLKHKGNQREDR
ncbi:MAG: rod-binding protein [Deltaproteobacteria bacterium]|nr:rod-binding protein [Deltaproteobacteria bacterium]